MNRPPLRALDDALADVLARTQPLVDTEAVCTFDADGRVLAQDLVSHLQVPPNDNTSMDGYAVRAAEITAPAAGLVSVSVSLPVSASLTSSFAFALPLALSFSAPLSIAIARSVAPTL